MRMIRKYNTLIKFLKKNCPYFGLGPKPGGSISSTQYPMKHTVLRMALILAAGLPLMAHAADGARQAEVARRGADVMPFDLKATVHVFRKTADGGTQRVVARNAADAVQVPRVRQHLRDIEAQFRNGDFSGPAHIHGGAMPGLAQLEAAKPGEIAIAYRDVEGGAQLTYRSANPGLVSALHAWFDAQVSDHGADAMAGHAHHSPGMHQMPKE